MFDTIAGLPLHPLVVHATEVIVPVTAIVVTVAALWPRFRRRAGYLPLALALASLVLVPLSTQSGEALQERVGESSLIETHSNLAEGLLALYQATFDERWFVAARDLMDVVLTHFADPAGGFFDTADDHEALIARPKSLQDNAMPSGGAMTATVLLKLAALTGEARYSDAATGAISGVVPFAHRYPTAFAEWLNAITFSVADPVEIAISGDRDASDTQALLDVVRSAYRPFAVVAVGMSEGTTIQLLQDRPQRDGRAAAYVCRHFACSAPVVEPDDLATQLASGS